MTKIFLFLGFLGAVGLLFWSARKKFQVDGELTWKKFFIGLTNRGTDLVFLVSAFVVAVFVFNFFSPLIEGLDSDSSLKSLLVLFFSGAIIVPAILVLKKIIGKKEMIFVYGFSFLAFALIVRAKIPVIFNISEPQFDFGVRVYLGALLVIWICSYWESKLQEVFALPVGFLILAVICLWSWQSKSGIPWQEYLKEPAIIKFLVALLVLQFLFYYAQDKWRKRIGYWGLMLPAFVALFLQGLTIVALFTFGGLSLEDLAFRRETASLIVLSTVRASGDNSEIKDLRDQVSKIRGKISDGIHLPSEEIELPFLIERLLYLRKEQTKFASEERGELKKEYSPEESLFWAQKRFWKEMVLPNFKNLEKIKTEEELEEKLESLTLKLENFKKGGEGKK